MSLIFIFVDGIGMGSKSRFNPFTQHRWPFFEEVTNGQGMHNDAQPVLGEGFLYTSVDANLGIGGLPQSGTGQASLFSGQNASKLAGKHFGPFPHSATYTLLEEQSLFHQLIKAGKKPHFINAYPDRFFEHMQRRNRWTCTTLMASAAGQKLNGLQDVKNGDSLTAEITQEAWRNRLGLDVDRIEPEAAAERLLRAAERYDLVLYEYYLTDKAGHAMDMEMSQTVLGTLDRFLTELLRMKPDDTALLLCSDHGNLEDLSVKTHTRNPVPLIFHGSGLAPGRMPESITDVSGLILEWLAGKP